MELDRHLGGQQVGGTEGSGAERRDLVLMLKSASLDWNKKLFRIVWESVMGQNEHRLWNPRCAT